MLVGEKDSGGRPPSSLATSHSPTLHSPRMPTIPSQPCPAPPDPLLQHWVSSLHVGPHPVSHPAVHQLKGVARRSGSLQMEEAVSAGDPSATSLALCCGIYGATLPRGQLRLKLQYPSPTTHLSGRILRQQLGLVQRQRGGQAGPVPRKHHQVAHTAAQLGHRGAA